MEQLPPVEAVNTNKVEAINTDQIKNTPSPKKSKNDNKLIQDTISTKKKENNLNKHTPETIEKLNNIASILENFVKSTEWNLKIKIHDKTDKTVVQIISSEDGKVIKQIPPEELLEFTARMEEMVGAFINETV